MSSQSTCSWQIVQPRQKHGVVLEEVQRLLGWLRNSPHSQVLASFPGCVLHSRSESLPKWINGFLMALIKRKESDFILLRKRKHFILSMWSPVHCSLAKPLLCDLVPSTASPSLISPAGTELCLLELCFRHYLWTRLAFLNISNQLQTGIF